MNFLEKDLEEIIYESMTTRKGRTELHNRGLCVSGMPFRQVKLGEYGRLDLVTLHMEKCKTTDKYLCNITVYELKKKQIDANALMQGCRYLTGLRHLFNYSERIIFDFSLCLIGRSVCQGDFLYLCNHLPENIEIYTYNYRIDGISFSCVNNGNWALTQPSFEKDIVKISSSPGFPLLRNILRFCEPY